MKLLCRRILGVVGFGVARHVPAQQGAAGDRLILLFDHEPPAHAQIDQFGWTFWFCGACKQVNYFERPLSRDQLSMYTRGHALFCSEPTEES